VGADPGTRASVRADASVRHAEVRERRHRQEELGSWTGLGFAVYSRGPVSKRASSRSIDCALLSAALRHVQDAEHLAGLGPLAAGPNRRISLDQAYHLAGFGPECARKAALAASWAHKPLGHELGDDADMVLQLALALDPTAERYDVQSWGSRYPALAAWTPESRYHETGTYDRAEVERLLRDAWLVVNEIMAALWADGRLALDELE
jgi:hypothetical protein